MKKKKVPAIPRTIHPALQGLFDKRRRLNKAISRLKDLRLAFDTEIHEGVVRIYNETIARTAGPNEPLHVDDLVLGGWECPTSPTCECVYNHATDPNRDSCLFCGKPQERK